jgi:hypothetical protein
MILPLVILNFYKFVNIYLFYKESVIQIKNNYLLNQQIPFLVFWLLAFSISIHFFYNFNKRKFKFR